MVGGYYHHRPEGEGEEAAVMELNKSRDLKATTATKTGKTERESRE